MTERTTAQIAARCATAHAALSAYTHLPALGHISLDPHAATAFPAVSGVDAVAAVAAWAKEFGQPVKISGQYSRDVFTNVDLAGMLRLQVYATLDAPAGLHAQVCELLGIPDDDGLTHELEPHAVLAALADRAGVAA